MLFWGEAGDLDPEKCVSRCFLQQENWWVSFQVMYVLDDISVTFCLIQVKGGTAHACFVSVSDKATSSSIFIPPGFSPDTSQDELTVQLCE